MVALPLIYKGDIMDGVNTMRVFQEEVFRYFGMCLVVFFIGNKYLTLFFLYNVFLFILNGGNVGKDYIYNLFIGLMIFMAAKTYFRSFKTDDIHVILWTGLVSMGFMIAQVLGLDPLYVPMNRL